MAKFQPALSMVLKHEGGLSDDPSDNGLITNMGISLRFYRRKVKTDAVPDDIRHLTVADVSKIYETYFWDRQEYAQISSQKIANRIFDLGVNLGPPAANSLLQHSINQINPDSHLVIDGWLGPKSLSAINKCDETILYDTLITLADTHYCRIATHGDDSKYLKGWLRRLHD